MAAAGNLDASLLEWEAAVSEFLTVYLHDWVYGRPAACVAARLHLLGEPRPVATGETDHDGSFRFALANHRFAGGHRLTLEVDSYFAALGIEAAYAEVVVDCRHSRTIAIHVAPFGYAVSLGR